MPANNYSSFEKLFNKKVDPWAFSTSPYEKVRFERMLELAKSVPHKTILEVGCAEGHFTKFLLQISKNVTAIDVSKQALERAKKRAPGAKYLLTSLDDFKIPSQKFDLIVASEVMYYVKDKKAMFEKLPKIGNYLLMSNWAFYGYLLSKHLKGAKLLKTRHVSRLIELLKYCKIDLLRLTS